MSWHFASRPKWIVRHVAVVLLVASMVVLGFWQLRRLDDKQAYKALVEARQEQAAAEVMNVVPAGAGVRDNAVDRVLYRNVIATGVYDDAETVVVENRTLNSAAGAWVLTPLRLDDGPAVVVNRGFVGFDRDGAIVPPAAPEGQVTVKGLVFPSQQRGRIGPRDPADGQLSVLARVDLERFAGQLGYDVLPAYVQLVDSDPPKAPWPRGRLRWCPSVRPSPTRGPTSPTPCSGSSSPPSRRAATCSCSGGSLATVARRRPPMPPTLLLTESWPSCSTQSADPPLTPPM